MLLINNKIKNYIFEKKISKDALGIMSGIPKSTIHGIINCKTEVKVGQLIDISKGLRVSPCFWFEESDSNIVHDPEQNYGFKAQIEILKSNLKDKDKLIARLEKELDRYETKKPGSDDLIMATHNGNYETPRMQH